MKSYEVNYIQRTFDGQGDQIIVKRTVILNDYFDLLEWVQNNKGVEILSVYDITKIPINLK